LTAEGKLRNCLFALNEVDLKSLLRGGAADEIAALVRGNVWERESCAEYYSQFWQSVLVA
jgi:cyclic pyranopterin phosphate synthase